jgi:AraC-like DNA-binding protein
MTIRTQGAWRSGLAELESLARRLGHELITSARPDRTGAAGLAHAHALPQGLMLYVADVELPPYEDLMADYRSEFVVSLCIEGAVTGRLAGGAGFHLKTGMLGAFHTPSGGQWALRTGETAARWRSVAVEVPAAAWSACLPGYDLTALTPGHMLATAEPWLLALAVSVGLTPSPAPTAPEAAMDDLRRQALALALWHAGLRALQPPRSAQVVGLQGARERRLMAAVRARIDADLAEPWSLRALGRQVGLAPRRLGTLFREAYGQGVMDYVLQQRLARARLLIEQGASVTQACFDTGYDNPASFSRAFRRAFGHAPRQTPR